MPILLTAPEAVRHARVAARDTVWGSRVIDRLASLEHAWSDTVATDLKWHIELNAEEPIGENAVRVAEAWESWTR